MCEQVNAAEAGRDKQQAAMGGEVVEVGEEEQNWAAVMNDG